MAFHPQPKTHKITFTETEPLDLEDKKDKGCRDNVLKVHYKQLLCISRATVRVVLLVRQVVHWIVRVSMKRYIRLMEGLRLGGNPPLSNLTSGCMRGEALVILKENCIRNSERYHNVMKIIPPQPRPLPAITLSFLCFGDSGDFTLLKGVCCCTCTVLLSSPLTSTDLVFLIFQRLPSRLSAHVQWGGGRSCKILRLYLIFCIKQIFS